jgi:hypothetical protein
MNVSNKNTRLLNSLFLFSFFLLIFVKVNPFFWTYKKILREKNNIRSHLLMIQNLLLKKIK